MLIFPIGETQSELPFLLQLATSHSTRVSHGTTPSPPDPRETMDVLEALEALDRDAVFRVGAITIEALCLVRPGL